MSLQLANQAIWRATKRATTMRDELKDEAKKVFFSKEIATAIVAIAGSFVEPVVGLAIAGGALYKKKVDYRAALNKTLQGHTMSWLYSTRKFPVY